MHFAMECCCCIMDKSNNSTGDAVSRWNKTHVKQPAKANDTVFPLKAATIVYTPCSTLRKHMKPHWNQAYFQTEFREFFFFYVYCEIDCCASFLSSHPKKKKKSSPLKPRNPVFMLFDHMHPDQLGPYLVQPSAFPLDKFRQSWVQTWVMPLFHLLTTAQHKPVHSKYDPPCYNVHHEVCVPNIENMCRSELDELLKTGYIPTKGM